MPPVLCNAIILPAGRGAGGIDPAASAWIAARVAAGETMTSQKRLAVANFIKVEKAAGRWGLLKSIVFPVSGVAAANAIDMVDRTVCTWVNSPTHAAGYVQGDGSSSYLDFNRSATSLGVLAAGGFMGAMIVQADSRTDTRSHIGVTNNAFDNAYSLATTGTDGLRYLSGSSSTNGTLTPRSAQVGLLCGVFTGSNRNIRIRRSGGVTQISNTGSVASGTNSEFRVFGMCRGAENVAGNFSDARYAAWFCGGLTTTEQVDAFTASFATFYTAYTGNAIPS